MRTNKAIQLIAITILCTAVLGSCKKFLEIPPPITTITTGEIFSNNTQAEWAVAAIYSKMINGMEYEGMANPIDKNFAAGLATMLGAFSADELNVHPGDITSTYSFASQNKLTLLNAGKTNAIWTSAYKVIYDANAVIEGIQASTSKSLIDSVRKQLTGEALALRAFSYFYLVNFYGDLPLVLTTDFNKTIGLTRAPVNKIYQQIKSDLIMAKSQLSNDFSVGNNERVRVNKWFAEALLARVYLYTGEYQDAINSATEVIKQTALFSIEPALSDVFLKNSRETIFQLKPSTDNTMYGNATPEGYLISTSVGVTLPPVHFISNQLLNAFETNDKRKKEWLKMHSTYYIPDKYKVGHGGGSQLEYYMVMRLAELYLIRAEAAVLLSPANKDNAIQDLNVLRRRADVDELENSLTADQVKTAIEHERRVELFMEWGHRWFDLKRTARAHDVLSAIPYNQPWFGDYQFLYPIPAGEIGDNSNLTQNPQYNFR